VLAAGGDHFAVGLGHARIAELARDAELEAEIVGADEERVDAPHGGDLLAVGEALRRLDHCDHEGFLVDDARGLADRDVGEAQLLQAAAHRALADRREAAGVRRTARLFRRIDMRKDDSLRAVVEHAGGVPVLEARDAH
jgi:hypothetical protein